MASSNEQGAFDGSSGKQSNPGRFSKSQANMDL